MSELEAVVAEATGVSPADVRISLRRPLEIQSNRLYDAWAGDRHLIVKEFLKPDEFQSAPAREFQALELLAPLDIAPRPVCFQPTSTPALGPLVIYEFMPGEMWDRHCPTAPELAQLAQVWLAMNAVPPDGLWPSRGHDRSFAQVEAQFLAVFRAYAAWAEAEFPPGQRVAALCLELLEPCRAVVRDLADGDPVLCFCRADPRFANVIRRPDGRLGLVDWEDSGLRDPARDLADIVTHPNQEDLLSPGEWQAFLEPYLAVRAALDPQLPRRVHRYQALFPIFWLAVLVGRGLEMVDTGQLAGWQVNELPANQRLRRYLARARAWPAADFAHQLEALAGIEFFPDCDHLRGADCQSDPRMIQ